jgi:L-serine dehydratase
MISSYKKRGSTWGSPAPENEGPRGMNSVFDIIGPAMIGPSSSHTAGAVRIGLVGRHLLGRQPAEAVIGLHGSFAATGSGHATDRAILAGLLGWAPDDARLKDSAGEADQAGLIFRFLSEDLGETVHPNTARLDLDGYSSAGLHLVASSVGGGSIEVVRVDGHAVRFSGTLDTLVFWHEDRPGFLAHVTAIFAGVEANIATIQTARRHRADEALTVIELDATPLPEVAALLRRIPTIRRLAIIPSLP